METLRNRTSSISKQLATVPWLGRFATAGSSLIRMPSFARRSTEKEKYVAVEEDNDVVKSDLRTNLYLNMNIKITLVKLKYDFC